LRRAYQPCGWTAPLARTVDLKTFQNQTAKPKRLNEKLWHEMLRGKTLNQSRVSPALRPPHTPNSLEKSSAMRTSHIISGRHHPAQTAGICRNLATETAKGAME